MAARVHIPALLRRLFNTQPIEEVEAESVVEMVTKLDERFPGMYDRLIEPDGSLRRWVNVFVEGEQARWEGDESTTLHPDTDVWIVPNVAGG